MCVCVCRTGLKSLSVLVFFFGSRADAEQVRAAVAVPLVGTVLLGFSLWPTTPVCRHGQQVLGCTNAGETKTFSTQNFVSEERTVPLHVYYCCGTVMLWPNCYLACWVCRCLKNI